LTCSGIEAGRSGDIAGPRNSKFKIKCHITLNIMLGTVSADDSLNGNFMLYMLNIMLCLVSAEDGIISLPAAGIT
jgi:hypothetical protein